MTPEQRIWLGRRPSSGLLGGLWALPSVRGDSLEALQEIGLEARGESVTIEHAFTHQVWKVSVVRADGQPSSEEFETFGVFTVDEMVEMGISGPSLKALRALGVPMPHRRGAGRS